MTDASSCIRMSGRSEMVIDIRGNRRWSLKFGEIGDGHIIFGENRRWSLRYGEIGNMSYYNEPFHIFNKFGV